MNYLNKLREYLFEGFEYVSDFGAKLDYEPTGLSAASRTARKRRPRCLSRKRLFAWVCRPWA